jgi:serine/threonine-protein kinase
MKSALALALLLPLTAAAQDKNQLALQARAVFKIHCLKCHHGEGSEGAPFDVLDDKTFKTKIDGEGPWIIPGKPEESLVWQRAGIKKSMPPKAITERPTDAELDIIKRWIAVGAPPYPPPQKQRDIISLKAVLTAVRDDLREADPEDRPYLRYFSITHLYNSPRVPDGDLAVYRAALSKAVNSLSWKPRIVLPQAIDKEQTIFAIDVRDFDWDREHLWQAIMAAYPYGLTYESHPDRAIQKLDSDIRDLTHCSIPLVRADWFVAAATRPPLYHTLLRLPKTAGELEKSLKVDVAANFRRNRLDRAGFPKSGVSEQNRVIERHDSVYGAYWKSYDFKKNAPDSDLVKLPLGPRFNGNPHPQLAFAQAGGEIIFNLPNGLQGYLLVNAKDERIDEGPIDVVGDATKTSGSNVIVTGLSCMACHKHGMVAPPRDTIREGAAVFGPARRKVERLLAEPKHFAELLQEDEERFLRAAEKATGPFLKVGAEAAKPVKDFPEPIGEIARLYTLQHLDLGAIACELAIDKPEALRGMIQGNRRLREMGLAPLLQVGGLLERPKWEAVGGFSLMQRAARELELGTPADVGR